LEAAIACGEIEASNLSHRMQDPEQRRLYRKLVFEVEMARGTLRQVSVRR
jgi:hypothetical protein